MPLMVVVGASSQASSVKTDLVACSVLEAVLEQRTQNIDRALIPGGNTTKAVLKRRPLAALSPPHSKPS